MTKAERLFQLVTLLRARRSAITAEAIAEKMGVSLRTVYRDVQALSLSGVPIDGASGVGYLLRPGNHLPPLMFDSDELQALLVGSRMVQAFTDPELGAAAHRAEQKIRSILTEPLKQRAEHQPYRIPYVEGDDLQRETHCRLRRACEARRKLLVVYKDEKGICSERILWPLGMIGWNGSTWTLLAWCELRRDYRNFRFDRFEELEPLEESYPADSEISISHYLRTQLGIRDPG